MKLLNCSPLRPELPALIYLPGMDGTGKLIHRQSKSLSDFFNLYSLALPPTDMSTWDELAQGVIAVIKSEVQRKSVYLCGESFGGCLALKIALKTPEMINKLILVNPASSLRQSSWLSFGISISHWLPELVHHTSALGLLPFLASLGRVEACDRRELLQAMRTLPQAVVCWRLSLLYDFFIEPFQFKQFTSPALIIASAADRLLSSVEEGQRLQSLFPQAQLEVLPQSGHACLLESAMDLTKILKQQNFLPA
ncbi:MAG: alpha/beta hydrolase [Snowella sp.]|nr:alpha/beta hydrolase [Snowella sp.]